MVQVPRCSSAEESIWMVSRTSSLQTSYHAQSEENMHWLLRDRSKQWTRIQLIIVDGGCTTSLTSSFEYCADSKPRITRVKTDERAWEMSISTSVSSIERYVHAVVIVNCHTGYRWLNSMKTRDEMLQVVKWWYSDTADLRQKHTLVMVMRDMQEKMSWKKLLTFLNLIMRIACTVMVESGLRGEIQVQSSLCREGCPQRHLQATAGVNTLHLHVQWSQGCFKILWIWMQGLGPPQLGKEREG